MKIEFLGTGAADWSIQKRVEGAEFRRFSSALIDGELLIDPGQHIFDYAEKTGQSELFAGVKNIIVTHSHGDHFNADTVAQLCVGKSCTLWADGTVIRPLMAALGAETVRQIDFRAVTPRRPTPVGDYLVTPLRSNHATDNPGEQTLNYIVERAGKRLFYGLDSGWVMYDSFCEIRKFRFDAMVFEATIGDVPDDDRIFGHTSLEMIEIMLRSLRRLQVVDAESTVMISHMARTLHVPHDRLVERCRPLGIIPAYDGMVAEI